MKTLAEIYTQFSGIEYGDKGTLHSYIEVYEALFAPFRLTAKRVLEIGILGGHSLFMWEDYFSGAEVHGIDIDLNPHGIFDLRPLLKDHRISILDATVKEQVDERFKGFQFDVIIDDASHALEHQLQVYKNFRDKLSPTGIYVVEDVADIDAHRRLFEEIDPEKKVEILDRRTVKNRFDDVLVIILPVGSGAND